MSRSLDSREFKLILKPNIFQNLNKGIKKVQKIIGKEVEMLNGKFKPDSHLEQKFRRTYYLDTLNFRLKSKNFFLKSTRGYRFKEIRYYFKMYTS